MPQSASLNQNLSSILQRKINSMSLVKIRAAPKTFSMDLCGREEFGNLVTWTILPSRTLSGSLLRFDRHPRDVSHRNPFNLSCLQHDHDRGSFNHHPAHG